MKRILAILLVLFLFPANKVLAANAVLKFVPSAGTYKIGDTFKVMIAVDSGGNKSQMVDTWGTFDNTRLELISLDKAPSPAFDFSMGDVQIDNVAGKFATNFGPRDSITYEMTPLNGDLAVLTFKAKALGSAPANFSCTPGESKDSNIWNETSLQDLIVCSSNQNGLYNIVANDGTTAPQAQVTTAPPAGELPKTGTVENTIVLMVMGVIGVLSSLALRRL